MWAVKSPELGVTASPQPAGRWVLAGGGAGRSPLAGTDLQRQPGSQDKGQGSAPRLSLQQSLRRRAGGRGGGPGHRAGPPYPAWRRNPGLSWSDDSRQRQTTAWSLETGVLPNADREAEPLARIPPCSPGERARRCSNRSGQPAASLTPHSCSGPVMRQSRRWGTTQPGEQAGRPAPGVSTRPRTAVPLESPPPASTFQAPEFIAEGSAGKAGPWGRWVEGRRRVQAPL